MVHYGAAEKSLIVSAFAHEHERLFWHMCLVLSKIAQITHIDFFVADKRTESC